MSEARGQVVNLPARLAGMGPMPGGPMLGGPMPGGPMPGGPMPGGPMLGGPMPGRPMPGGPMPGGPMPGGPMPGGPMPGGPMPGGPMPGGPMGAPGLPPGMMLNPAFIKWSQGMQAWLAEKQRRDREFAAACALIREDVTTGFKIDIEADSTVAADEQAEKAARTEFLQSVIPMMQLLIPQAQQNPASVPLIHALVMFGVRAFPAARGLEPAFEAAFRTLLQSPAPPDQQEGKGGGLLGKSPMEIASDEKVAQAKIEVDKQKSVMQIASDQKIAQAKTEIDKQKAAISLYEAYLKHAGVVQQHEASQQETAVRAAELGQQRLAEDNRAGLEQARLSHLIRRDTGGMV